MGASATDAFVYTAVNNAAGMQNYMMRVTLTGTVKAAKYFDMHRLLDDVNTKVNHVKFIRQQKTPYAYAFGSFLKYDNIAPMTKSAAFAFKMST
jgi:hypothetical protein